MTLNWLIMISMVSCQKGPTRHAYAWQIGPFWQDTFDIIINQFNHGWTGWSHMLCVCEPSIYHNRLMLCNNKSLDCYNSNFIFSTCYTWMSFWHITQIYSGIFHHNLRYLQYFDIGYRCTWCVFLKKTESKSDAPSINTVALIFIIKTGHILIKHIQVFRHAA